MGRDAKRAKQARRDKRRRAAGGSGGEVPPWFEAAMRERWEGWNRAIAAGLMEEGAETKYHFTPDGKVLSVAVGKSGQILANGQRLTPSFAEQLHREMPFLAGMVTFYENNQAAGRGLEGGPEDGVTLLEPPGPPEEMPPVDEAALAKARATTEALVRQGKVSGAVGAMVIPSQRGVMFAVGGVDRELYVNGQVLTEQLAARLCARTCRTSPRTWPGPRPGVRSGRTRRRRTVPSSWAAAPIRTATACTDDQRQGPRRLLPPGSLDAVPVQRLGANRSRRRSFCWMPRPRTRRLSEISSSSRTFWARTLPMSGSDSMRVRTGILRTASEPLASTSASDSLPCLSASLTSARSLRAAAAFSRAARRCSGLNGGRAMRGGPLDVPK